MEALKLVLKFRASEHARARELQRDCLERISGPSFPPELLTLVVETTVGSQVPYWRIDQSNSLADVANKAFRKWPENFGGDSRCLFREISARAMLKHSLIIIPATFTLQCTLTTPPEAQGSEHRIRRLALDLHTTPRDGAHNRELSRYSKSMASLKLLFPSLESCVIMIHLAHNTGHVDYAHITTNALGWPSYVVSNLNCRNLKSIGNVITLEETFVEFIANFLRHGPGKRKLVRFTHISLQCPSLKRIGPLADVRRRESIVGVLGLDALTSEEEEEDQFTVDAKHAFREAYWGKGGPMGDWDAAFREG
ncbi:hypothetical protein Q7P35_010097 [Cladosporium inversicolor]